jgi:outer membrane lipoprotein SlyB
MNASQEVKRPVRVGVFGSVTAADAAIVRLLNAGFSKSELIVVAPRAIKDHFHELHASEPGGEHAARSATTAGTIGGIIGGVIAAAALIGTGGGALVIAGPLIAASSAGVIAGGFIGAMMSRGFDKEAATFYDQAVQEGKILVGVQCEETNQRDRLALAERVLAEAGADPLPLREG